MPVASTHDRAVQLRRLVDRHQPQLLAYARRMTGGDIERAQDAVQETFLRLCREDLSRLEGRIAPWLFAVCRTRVIDMQRTNPPTQVCSDQVAQTTAPDEGPAESAEWLDEQHRLATHVSQLPSRQQEVLRLRLQAGLTYREIAEVTGTTVNNVGVQLHQAIRTLRQRMAAT